MGKIFLIVIIFFTLQFLNAQETITFEASDGLKITADLYEINKDFPYILFFHQENASRGEFRESAKKFLNLGYNCLVVDLRTGDEINYVTNETAIRAKNEGKPTKYIDAENDILAAIEYCWAKNQKPVILFGSSFSASLCLKVAKGNEKIKGVVAFSPGEFLQPYYNVKDGLTGFDKLVFAASSQREFKYMEEMFANVDETLKKLFSPKNGPGEHGAKSLWNTCPVSREYWWELNLFFKKLK